jgi:HlyD family secretion protein
MKVIITFLAIVLVAGSTAFVLNQGGAVTSRTRAAVTPVATTNEANAPIVAQARVVPAGQVELRYPTNNTLPETSVAEVLVHEGDAVAKGAALARLDTRDLQLRVEEAQAALSQTKASYDRLAAGAAPEEINQARALVSVAQAKLHETRGNVTPQDIAAAQAQITQARATRAQLLSGPDAAKIQGAQATLDRARANLQSQRDSLSVAKTDAQLRMEQAANNLRNQQDDYNRIHTENAALGSKLDQASKDKEAAALRAMQDAELALQQATVAYEQAKQAEITGIQAAEADVRNAQAAVDGLQTSVDAGQIAATRALEAAAMANLAKLQGDQRAGSLEAAVAEQASAQANLDKIAAHPRAVDLAFAQAQIQQAEVAVKRAQLALDLATLRSPIDATVAQINLNVGEVPSLVQPAFVLADLSSWMIETQDLTEQNVVRVHEGDPVTITFDALPGFQMAGKVSRIKSMGTNTATNFNIMYTVVIAPAQQDKRLHWNMTASVTITPGAESAQAAPQSTNSKGPETAPTATPPKPTAAPAAAPTSAAPAAPTSAAPAAPKPTAGTGYIEYTVQKGDILTAIAQHYGVSTKDILAINKLENPDSLRVGQVIHIPKK